jgi:excisionase family DNA binding protein
MENKATEEATMVDQEFFTLAEIAERLKVSYRTVYRWVQDGKLPAYKFGTEWRISSSDLEEFIQDHRAGETKSRAEEAAEEEAAERQAEEDAELQAEEDAERQAEEDAELNAEEEAERQAEEDAELNAEEEAERRAPFLDR